MTWVFIPTRVPAGAGTSVRKVLGSCRRRNDGVKALAFNDLFRVSPTFMAGSEILDWQEPLTKFYDRNFGITSLAKSSIERNTLECSILPKDILAPKYPMPCSSRNLVIRSTHCSGVPK